MKTKTLMTLFAIAALALGACSDDDSGTNDAANNTANNTANNDDGNNDTENNAVNNDDNNDDNNTPDDAACQAHVLPDDFKIDDAIGPMGDPANWPQELPPTAVVSTTYLRLQENDTAEAAFDEIMAPIIGDLLGSEGLMGVSFARSRSCEVTRTLSLWETEEAMMNFVLGEAHLNAIQRVGEVSRGGSITDHWPASDFETLNWESIVPELVNHDGPVY